MLEEKSSEILEIVDVDSILFIDAIQIYVDSFPLEERQSIITIKDRIINKQIKFFVYQQSNLVLGICILWDFSILKTYFVDYFAIRKDARSSGHGLFFLNELFKNINNEYSVVLEVEKPHSIEDNIKIKRIDFYKKLKFNCIENFNYWMPSFQENDFLEMALLFKGKNSQKFLNKQYLFDLVLFIYKNVYNKEQIFGRIIEANKNEYYQLN